MRTQASRCSDQWSSHIGVTVSREMSSWRSFDTSWYNASVLLMFLLFQACPGFHVLTLRPVVCHCTPSSTLLASSRIRGLSSLYVKPFVSGSHHCQRVPMCRMVFPAMMKDFSSPIDSARFFSLGIVRRHRDSTKLRQSHISLIGNMTPLSS